MLLLPLALLATTQGSPVPFLAIEARCFGGRAGRTWMARMAADGQLTRSDRRNQPLMPAGRMTTVEARNLFTRLDRASFAALKTLPRSRTVYDGVTCSITRIGVASHTVEFLAGAQAPAPGAKHRYQEVRGVMSAILNATEHVKLNPQPIPPQPSRPRGEKAHQ